MISIEDRGEGLQAYMRTWSLLWLSRGPSRTVSLHMTKFQYTCLTNWKLRSSSFRIELSPEGDYHFVSAAQPNKRLQLALQTLR